LQSKFVKKYAWRIPQILCQWVLAFAADFSD